MLLYLFKRWNIKSCFAPPRWSPYLSEPAVPLKEKHFIFYKGIFSTSLTSNVECAQWPLHNGLSMRMVMAVNPVYPQTTSLGQNCRFNHKKYLVLVYLQQIHIFYNFWLWGISKVKYCIKLWAFIAMMQYLSLCANM